MWVGNGKGGGKKVEIIIHLAKLGGGGVAVVIFRTQRNKWLAKEHATSAQKARQSHLLIKYF